MADQNFMDLASKTASGITGTDYMMLVNNSEAYKALVNDVAEAILGKLTSKSFSGLETTAKNLISAVNELNSKTTQGNAKIVGLTNISSIKITNISSLYGSILITTNIGGINNSPACALVYLNGEDDYGVVFITGNQNELTASYEEAELNINFNARIHGTAILGGSISDGTGISAIY